MPPVVPEPCHRQSQRGAAVVQPTRPGHTDVDGKSNTLARTTPQCSPRRARHPHRALPIPQVSWCALHYTGTGRRLTTLSHIISQIASSSVFCCNTTDVSTTIGLKYEQRRV